MAHHAEAAREHFGIIPIGIIAGPVQMSVGLMLSLGIGKVAEYIRYKAEFDSIDLTERIVVSRIEVEQQPPLTLTLQSLPSSRHMLGKCVPFVC